METRGRKRKFDPTIPAHIDQNKIPDGCYWDKRRRYWRTVFIGNDGKSKSKRIAGESATLVDLYKIIDSFNGIDRHTFKWIAEQYFKSSRYTKLAKTTKSDYQYCYEIICTYQTKLNKPLSDIPLEKWTSPFVQRLVDKLTKNRGATSSKHTHGFIRLVFGWGKNRGYCKTNPAIGTELPKERKRQRLPSQQAYDRLLDHAKSNGTHGQKVTGSCPYYIWAIMEIEYLCRLRGVECRNLTDEHVIDDGLFNYRRKGSKTNITAWNQRLKNAVEYLQKERKKIWDKSKTPYPMSAANRPLIVNTFGQRLNKSAYNSSWQRFIKTAISIGLITEADRFSLHDLKRKGITDTKGTKADKMEASGHKDPRMMDVYDKSVSVVKPSSD